MFVYITVRTLHTNAYACVCTCMRRPEDNPEGHCSGTVYLSLFLKEGVLVGYCCDKHYDHQSDLRRKGFVHLTAYSPLWKEGGKARNPRQEPGCRNQSRTHEGMLLTISLPMDCSVWFLIAPRSTYPGETLLTVGWDFPHQSLIKKLPHRLAYMQPYGSIFPTKVPSF